MIHLARGMALGRGGIDTGFWLDAALFPGGTWPLAGASKKNALRLTARLTQSFWVEHMVSLRALSFCDNQPCRRSGGRVWGGGRLLLKLATLTEAGQHFCLVFENVPLLVQTHGPLRQSHPYDWRSKNSVAEIGHWILMRRVLTSFCCQRHCHSYFWLFSAYIQLPMLNHPNWALKT